MAAEQQPDPTVPAPTRKVPYPLLYLFLAAFLVHVVLAIVLSPGIFRREDTTPAGLLEKARTLMAESKYQEALEVYEQILLQKPTMPVVFTEAEQELNQARLKALEAQRKAASALAAEAGPDAGGKPGEPGDADAGKPEKPTEVPPVELPALPDIGE